MNLRIESDLTQERDAQDRKWGEQNHPNGTGSWEFQASATMMRDRCQAAFRSGEGTWEHVLSEEIYEAYAEEDPEKLRAELVQCGAVIIAWIESIDRARRAAKEAHPTNYIEG